MLPIDLSKPSVSGAHYFARETGLRHMRAAGRASPNQADTEILLRELARLLYHVEYSDGGFLGASDRQAERRANELSIPLAYVNDALWHRGAWPSEPSAKEAA